MNNRKYKIYLQEICAVYGFSAGEVNSLFSVAVARAYDAIGSAYIWEDGTVTVAKDDRGQVLYIQDFIISAKQYQRIIKIFMKLIQELSTKRSTLAFARGAFSEIVEMKIIKKNNMGYILKPVLDIGDASGYDFFLSNKKKFYDEEFFVDNKVLVVCKGFNRDTKIINVVRFDKKICEVEFSTIFNAMVKIVEEDYSYKKIHFQLDYKARGVIVFIKWESKPSSFFLSKLNSEVEKKFGRWKIPINIRS